MGKRALIGVGVLALLVVAAGGGYFYGLSVGEARASQPRQQFAQFARQRFGVEGAELPDPAQALQAGGEGGMRPDGGITARSIQSFRGFQAARPNQL
jgi:hypothetical protein